MNGEVGVVKKKNDATKAITCKRKSQFKGDYATKASKSEIIKTNEVVHQHEPQQV